MKTAHRYGVRLGFALGEGALCEGEGEDVDELDGNGLAVTVAVGRGEGCRASSNVPMGATVRLVISRASNKGGAIIEK